MQDIEPSADDPKIPMTNLNLKVTEDEKWAFKEFCAHHRMTQVEGFRRAFELLKQELSSVVQER